MSPVDRIAGVTAVDDDDDDGSSFSGIDKVM